MVRVYDNGAATGAATTSSKDTQHGFGKEYICTNASTVLARASTIRFTNTCKSWRYHWHTYTHRQCRQDSRRGGIVKSHGNDFPTSAKASPFCVSCSTPQIFASATITAFCPLPTRGGAPDDVSTTCLLFSFLVSPPPWCCTLSRALFPEGNLVPKNNSDDVLYSIPVRFFCLDDFVFNWRNSVSSQPNAVGFRPFFFPRKATFTPISPPSS